jgi:hypothetical protein
MRAIRSEEFAAVQRESTQVVAVLRKVLFTLRLAQASSPVQGGFSKSPSPSEGATVVRVAGFPAWAGSGWGLPWVIRPRATGTIAYSLGAVKVTDRRNSRLRCYFRHGG